ncbi:MAG: helix-turn-helix domain-containing protein [Pirellula sp.]
MTEEDGQRTISKRQIARLIGGADYPAYVLSESGQIVFANDALGKLLQCDPDALIGWECGVQRPDAPDARPFASGLPNNDRPDRAAILARWLGPFPNADPRLASIQRDRLPLPPSAPSVPTEPTRAIESSWEAVLEPVSSDEHEALTSKAGSHEDWVRISIPLDRGEAPLVLVFLKPDRGDIEGIRAGWTASPIKHAAIERWLAAPSLDDLWFPQGSSAAATSMRNQMMVACSGHHSLCIRGVEGSPAMLVANTIFRARNRSQAPSDANRATRKTITIDCRLIDRDLLQSLFDWIDDESRHGQVPTVIVDRIELLPPELRQPLARKQQSGGWQVIATTRSADLFSSHQDLSAWSQFLGKLQSQSLELTPLSDRLGDIESLIAAWLGRCPASEKKPNHWTWTREFLEAMQAYSWPGDCDEFDGAMRHACECSEEGVLRDSHLPISLRTFPSHMAREKRVEPVVLDELLEQFEKELIQRAMQRFPRNRTAAAKLLGISRARLLRRLQQWGMESVESERPAAQDEVIFEEFDGADDAS